MSLFRLQKLLAEQSSRNHLLAASAFLNPGQSMTVVMPGFMPGFHVSLLIFIQSDVDGRDI
jgi:hypothetical protein